jgi:protein disulfide-isomerase A1
VNAEANELPQIKIEGFPTIKLWPAGKKDAPVDYQGERNEQGLVDFVKQHATHKWFDDKRDEL